MLHFHSLSNTLSLHILYTTSRSNINTVTHYCTMANLKFSYFLPTVSLFVHPLQQWMAPWLSLLLLSGEWRQCSR